VFAESYDEPNESNKLKSSNTSGNSSTKKGEFGFDKIPNCPNRVNTFHECTDYCAKKYGFKKFQPHPVLERRRLRMLKIYPLLPNWVEVPDLET
jgi:polyglutamine-binding protein 1